MNTAPKASLNSQKPSELQGEPAQLTRQYKWVKWGGFCSFLLGLLCLLIQPHGMSFLSTWALSLSGLGAICWIVSQMELGITSVLLFGFSQVTLWFIVPLGFQNQSEETTIQWLILLILTAFAPLVYGLYSQRLYPKWTKAFIAYHTLLVALSLYRGILLKYSLNPEIGLSDYLVFTLFTLLVLSVLQQIYSDNWRRQKLNHLSKKMARQYSENREQFESLMSNLNNSFFFQFYKDEDERLQYTYFSPNIEEFFGLILEKVQADPNLFVELFHPDDRNSYIESRNEAIEKNQSIDFIGRFRYATGQYHWTKFHVQPAKKSKGVFLFNGMIQDIHENFLLEERIRESQQFLHRLTSSMPDALFSIEYNSGSPIFLTGHYLRLLGYSSSELRSMENFPQGLIPPDHLKDFQLFWKNLNFKFGQIHEVEVPLLRKDQSIEWFLLRTSLLKINAQYQPLHLLMILTNIEQRKETETRLRESEERYERAVNGTNDGIWEWEMDTGNFTVSDRFLSNLGMSRREWNNSLSNWESLIDPEHRDHFWHHINQQAESHKNIDIELKLMHKVFGYRWYHVRGSSMLDAKKEFTLISGSLRDIHSVKMDRLALKDSKEALEILTEEMRSRNQQLENYADITSHNLRSPISNIISLTELISQETHPEQIRIISQKMQQTADNLNATLFDLHKVLKIKRNTELSKNEIEFERIFNQVRDSLIHLIMDTNAEVMGDFSAAPTIKYHQPYLESIFLNLLTNSIKYRHPNRVPIVLFESRKVGDTLQLTCKDNGLGIDLQKHGHKIFGLHKTFHRGKDSRGVGLFMTRNQVESQGGTVSVKSTVGEGSVFTVRF